MAPGSSVKIAIVGAGSIGSRHAQILRDSRHEVVVVSRQSGAGKYEKISDALKHEKFEYVVVASKTSQHFDDLRELSSSKFSGKVLVEKPILTSLKKLPKNSFDFAAVGYNLRFHPAIAWLRDTLPQLGDISSANFYIGQYLPTWRKNDRYQNSSSATIANGGGALRDSEIGVFSPPFTWRPKTAVARLGAKCFTASTNADQLPRALPPLLLNRCVRCPPRRHKPSV